MECPMRNRVWSWVVNKLAILVTFMGIITCAPNELCFTDNDTQVKISFKKEIYSGTDSAFFENDTLIFSRITALDTDSIFVDSDTLSTVVLPVNTGVNFTVFLFDSDRGRDTLELSYKTISKLISVECGPEQIIEDLGVGVFTFDSLAILNSALLEQVNTNVEVYR
jgi:hypothetical protein